MGDHQQQALVCRGVRGAIVATENSPDAIGAASAELLAALFERNGIRSHDVASIFFTTTPDLDAAYPASGARKLGLPDVALLCAQEIAVPGGIPRCVRVLIHWNTRKPPEQIVHLYLGGAEVLRPDRAQQQRPRGQSDE